MKKKLLHIRESNIWGSPERLILGQIQNSNDFECIPVTYRKRGNENPLAHQARQMGIGCFELNEYFTGDLFTILRLVRLIKKVKPSLLVSHEYKSNLYSYLASKLTGIPHIIHFHGFTAEDTKTRLYNAIDIGVMKRAVSIITVSSETAARLARAGINKKKIEVVINAVADSAFEKVPFIDNPAESDIPLLVSAGRLSFEKGFDILVKALAHVKNQNHRFHVLIYGDGPEKEKLQGLIDNNQLSDSVKLAGFVSDLRAPFGAMEFLIIPSRSEGFPLVLLEAWAQGAPVVSTPVGGLPGLINENETGLLASEVGSDALAEAIIKALTVEDFKSRCGAAGKKLTKKSYNFNVQLQRLEEIYSRRAI